jgi:hypothetical protein
MEKQPEGNRKKYSAKYQAQQESYWINLKAELDKYRQNCGATVSELADGLEISRQRLYEFLNDPSVGLPINWANLMGLWDCLTQPDEKIANKLKPAHRENRDRLKKEGAKHLLERSGFVPQLPQVNGEKTAYQISSIEIKNPQVYRAASRLNSSWIQDDAIRTDLANEVLDLVLKRGKLNRQSHIELSNERNFIEEWPVKELGISQESEALKKYKQEIRKLFDSGKQEFIISELFELYCSIDEHEELNLHIPNHIYITDCQFRILSNSIRTANEETKQQFAEAEHTLIDFLRGLFHHEDPDYSKDQDLSKRIDSILTSNPVIEVAIGCNFSYNNKIYPSVIWRYSSTAPHIRNMFIAIKNGLGYPFQLAGISTRSTGRLEGSLIRSEVLLADPEQEDKVYQGWWVESNTIHSVLRAAVDAVKRWLSDQNLGDISRYYESFQKIAEIDEKLFVSRASFYSRIPGLNYTIAEDCVKEIQEINRHFSNEEGNKYFQQHISLLKRKSRTAQLTQIHIALLEGNIQEATKFLNLTEEIALIESAQHDAKSQENSILILNASSCLMFYYLLVGEQPFLKDRQWREHQAFSLENNMGRLGDYILMNGCIDADAYLYASQFLGTVGYLEFYTAQTAEDIPFLEKAINNLLSAAHYACRIGHMKRALHWLAYASRIYCRLGDLERAQYYSNLAQREAMVSTSLNWLGDVEPLMTYSEFADKVYSSVNNNLSLDQEEQLESSGNNRDWSMPNIYLSKGEINLFRGDCEKALEFFVNALELSIYNGFSRLAADSLYDIYRASTKLNAEQISGALAQRNNSREMWGRNEFTQKLEKFVTALEQTRNQDISIQLCDSSKAIWDDWANVKVNTKKSVREDTRKRIHPFSQLIQEGLFLEEF